MIRRHSRPAPAPARRPLSLLGALLACAALWTSAAARPARSRPEPGATRANPKIAVRLDDATGAAAPARGGPASTPSPDRPGPPGPEGRAVLVAGEPALEVRVPASGLSDAWLLGYLPDRAAARDFRRSLGSRAPGAGGVLRIPLQRLGEATRVRLLLALFPGSGPRGGAWVHRVGGGRPGPPETLEQIALWYTGRAGRAAALRRHNHLDTAGPRSGREVAIPAGMLLPAFARLVEGGGAAAAGAGGGETASAPPGPAPSPEPAGASPAGPGLEASAGDTVPFLPPLPRAGEAGPAPAAKPAPPPETPPEDDFTEAPAAGEAEEEGPGPEEPAPSGPPPMAEGAEDLTYGRDAQGRYAAYKLKKGEALYTAVVVRFTGRVDVGEVNDLATRIAARSGIRDVTDIPIGFKVKIGVEDLLPEYMPRDDPRRLAWEKSHADVARYTNAARSRDLEGVAVILDAGHGGRDIGTSHYGIWEHDYVYDILCRIKAILEKRTRARVLPIIKDMKEGYRIHNARKLKRSRAEVLLTNPPYHLVKSVPSVNMRWYLSNSLFRKLVKKGYDPLKIVFTSLHADSRHPSLGGAMVYVPGEEYRRGRYGNGGATYARYAEAREAPFVRFTRKEREQSEGLSRQFAEALIDAFGDKDVSVHPFEPVRERIIRRGRAWVPAVLRCNKVPVEVLIEVSNLRNRADNRRLADPAYRQKVAEAYVAALEAYFAGPAAEPPAAVETRAR